MPLRVGRCNLPSEPGNIESYLKRATELRELAQTLHTEEARELLQNLATSYERLAEELKRMTGEGV